MIGIDLGTSNSAIAVFDDGEAVVTKVTPSVVAYLDEEVVGHAARNLQLLFPDAVVASSKRHMGTTHVYDTPMGPRTPEEVAAAILRRLTKPCAAVITVPAYFGDAERRATLKAAALAGIEVLRLLNEPTAAALQYDQRRERETILVYDLGGGTFDASLVEVTGELRHVKATRGIARLGGDDIDALLGRKLGVPARAAEKAKIALSTLRECRVSEVVGGKHVRAHVSRDELEALMTPLIERTTDLCAELLRDAGMRSERVDRVCLVGGPTRAPLIRDMIERALGIPAHVDLEPELAVVKGAAIQAAILAGEQPRRALIDVASHSLGIAAAEPDQDVTVDKPDSFVAIIKRNTPLPCKRVEIFETAQDNQSSVVVDIYQGEAEKASDNRHLGELELPLVPSPAGTEVAVAFSYDLDGVVQVELVHAGETQTRRLLTQAATPRADTAIARRVAELLPQLGPDARAKLQAAYDAWCLDPAAHDDQLLDLFLSH